MTNHRITYDVVDTARGRRFTGECRCGARRTARTSAAVSHWGPAHVVTAWEAEHR